MYYVHVLCSYLLFSTLTNYTAYGQKKFTVPKNCKYTISDAALQTESWL